MHIRNLAEGRWNMERPRRQQCLPWGLEGGMPGEAGSKMLRRKGETEFVDVDISRHLVPGDTEVRIDAGSGGGWGNPFERDVERVRWDVIEGLVSKESARRHYGVVLTNDLTVDEPATLALRSH
jgi:N-methylhydantoinase B